MPPGAAAGDREPSKHDAEDDDQDQTEKEGGHSLADDGDGKGHAVDPGVGTHGGQHPHRDAQENGKYEGAAPKGHRDTEAATDDVFHGLVEIVRLPEITLEGPLGPGRILDDHWAVHAVLHPNELDFLGGGVDSGQSRRGVAGKAQQHEGHEGDREGDQNGQKKTFESVSDHGCPKSLLEERGCLQAPLLFFDYFHLDRKNLGTASGWLVKTRSSVYA